MQYTVGIKVNCYHVDDNSAENSVVTISQAINGMITGGGYLVNSAPSSSGGQYAADAGQKTNFGFNVKYNKSLTNLHGNINTIVRSRVYQVKGNALLQVTMTDKGEPGKDDTIAIQLSNTNGSLLLSSKWSGTKTVEQILGGGNLVVR